MTVSYSLPLGAAFLALCLSTPALGGEPKARTPEILVEALPLNSHNPQENRVGRLTYLGGMKLSSQHWLFGGFSGLEVSADGKQMLSMSDRGTWWTARFVLKDGVPVGFKDNVLLDMADAAGQTLPKDDQDSEGLTVAGGYAYVSFERNHRVQRYRLSDPADITSVAGANAEALPVGDDWKALPFNGGLEAMTTLSDGTLFLLSEEGAGADGYFRGWLKRGNGAYEPFDYPRKAPFNPTDAERLPNGDILVLERRYSLLGGLGARLCVIEAATIKPQARLVCDTVAEMQPPHNIDNMEGLAVRRNKKGETIVYVIADNNFSALQRTVLLIFRLDDTPAR